VAEQGRPEELLANPQSRLAGLWKNAGLPQG
jgi:ABC-type multidrug transport system fused ATPase/permease subunit